MTAAPRNLRLAVLEDQLAVCRLDASNAPPQAPPDGFFSVTRTADELSVVCSEESAPDGARCEKSWRPLKLEGTFEFSEVGVLASVAAPLAEAGVGIFAISTFDTDYVLVKGEQLAVAVAVLREAGHEVLDDPSSVAVRAAGSDDEPFLWEMLYEAVHWGPGKQGPKPPPEALLSEPGLARYLAGWGREGDLAVIAVDADAGTEGERRIGAAWCRLFSHNEPGYGFVDERTPELAIAVADGHRDRGVGGTLLAALKNAARTRGLDALSLSVEKTNPGAARLYKRNGFVEVRDGGEDLIMKLDLS